jgi:DNA-binding protein H-NS
MPRSLSLETIQARINELQKKADTIKTKAKPGVKKVFALIKKHKLTPDDLKDAFSAKRGRSAKATKETKKAKRVSVAKGKKAPIKFKDNNGNNWSGRGRAPKWIQEAEKAGKDRSSFAVK